MPKACFAMPLLLAMTFSVSALAQPFGKPQKGGATMDDVSRHQEIGRVVTDPNGKYFAYEWLRPYSWSPNNKNLPPAAVARKQAFLYLAYVKDPTGSTVNAKFPRSEYLMPMEPGATYYLGDFSNDGKFVSFYELDRDDRSLKAGIVEIAPIIVPGIEQSQRSEGRPRITWSSLPPDDVRLDMPTVWSKDGKFLYYPVKGGVARLDAATGEATVCGECRSSMLKRVEPPKTRSSGFDKEGLSKDANLMARSTDGSLEVFAVDTPQKLSLYLRKNGRLATLFENSRE